MSRQARSTRTHPGGNAQPVTPFEKLSGNSAAPPDPPETAPLARTVSTAGDPYPPASALSVRTRIPFHETANCQVMRVICRSVRLKRREKPLRARQIPMTAGDPNRFSSFRSCHNWVPG